MSTGLCHNFEKCIFRNWRKQYFSGKCVLIPVSFSRNMGYSRITAELESHFADVMYGHRCSVDQLCLYGNIYDPSDHRLFKQRGKRKKGFDLSDRNAAGGDSASIWMEGGCRGQILYLYACDSSGMGGGTFHCFHDSFADF